GEHRVRGAGERDRPQPQRAEGAEDVLLLQGLGGARGGQLLHAVQLQLLLAGADAAPGQPPQGLSATDPGDGGRPHGSYLDPERVVIPPSRATPLRHYRDYAHAGNTFTTPTVVHFGVVLLLSAVGSGPWDGIAAVAVLWGLVGIAGVAYVVL